MSNRSLRRRIAAAVLVGACALTATAVALPSSVSAGPFNYGSAKVAVQVDAAGVPRVLQSRSAYVFSVPAGTRPSISRNGVGNYTIVLPRITATDGNVQIAPWSSGRDEVPPVCTVAGWYGGDPGISIDIRCFDARTGAPREGTRFDVLYTNIPNGFGRSQYTYLWTGSSQASDTPVVDPGYYFSGRGAAAPTVQRAGRGRYLVSFNEPMRTWTPIVTAYGSTARWCHPADVTRTSTAPTIVEVVCFGPSGGSADSLFTLMMTNGSPLSGDTAGSARVRISRPTATRLVTPRQFSVSASASPNTYLLIGPARHKVVMPGVRTQIDAGVVQAYGPFGVRCFIAGLVSTVTDPGLGGYRVRCLHPEGGPYGTRVWAVRADMTHLWAD